MSKTATASKGSNNNNKELPPFKDLVDVGEILPDSSGKVAIKVRITERRSDGVRLVDVRQFITNPDKTKYSGPTPKGVSFASAEEVDELIDLLATAKDELTKLGKSKKAKKADDKKKAKK